MIITVTVPKNADGKFFDDICAGFKKKYGDDISFKKELSDGIIGGFIAEVGGTVYDTSIRSKLDEIKRVMTE